ncbi:ribonuclease H2 subunit A-like [Saccoglossus kowalevskii]|uniref:Ribonuclease n=1 Tax=Saccoglossus kowalevskii TaxID=10224 RepID=A0ABM0GQ90_SACKO|nr:PREDICTED: ribonuclease H2 subunit A-like [Saccoglossus kowalevskii]
MSIDLSEFEKNNGNNYIVRSEVPEICKSEPCCFGIDEAGRGPVLGPMVYGICYCPISKNEQLAEMGFADSKTLSEEQREELFTKIYEANQVLGYKMEVLSPNIISNSMFRRTKCSLNTVSKDSAIKLLRLTIEEGANIKEVYVDTVGDASKYQAYLKELFPDLEITVTPKADAKFPIVSAASICAKVCRDRAVKSWQFPEFDEINETPYGSGYPNDPATKQWLSNVMEPVFGFPRFVRFSWSTADKILEEKAVPVYWDDDEDGDNGAKGTPSVMSFFSSKDSDPRLKKHHYFNDRHLTQVTDF